MSFWDSFKRYMGMTAETVAVPHQLVVEAAEPVPFDRVMVGPLYSVGSKSIQDGEYVSTLNGEAARRPDGEWEVVYLDAGDRFPPLPSGYKWRKLLDPSMAKDWYPGYPTD
jgi:hypothetical protein